VLFARFVTEEFVSCCGPFPGTELVEELVEVGEVVLKMDGYIKTAECAMLGTVFIQSEVI
jgi:hypothetical protein